MDWIEVNGVNDLIWMQRVITICNVLWRVFGGMLGQDLLEHDVEVALADHDNPVHAMLMTTCRSGLVQGKTLRSCSICEEYLSMC